MTKKQVLVMLCLGFMMSIAIRIPSFERPLSKHHEYLPAVVLMNAESWVQAGGGATFNYTPIMNYQNKGDKYLKDDIVTKDGNIVYLSIGPGWYVIPYFVFKIFGLPVSVYGLRILNLTFEFLTLLLSTILFYRLLKADNRKNIIVPCAVLIILFSPGALWYFGNGYTHSAIVLPFSLLVAIMILPMIGNVKKLTPGRLFVLMVLLIIGIYIDWFVLFLGISSLVVVLAKIRENRKYLLLIISIVAGLISGVLLVFLQFASYVGFEKVKQYWVGRFFANADLPLFQKILMLLSHYLSAYFPFLTGIILCMFITRKARNLKAFFQEEKTFIFIWTMSLALYHVILFNWSFVHEFSVIPAAIVLGYIFAKYLSSCLTSLSPKVLTGILATILFISVLQYYYINPPGKKSLTGMPYETYERFGKELSSINGDIRIFMNMREANPMIEYYAKRNITNALDTAEAKNLMKEWKLENAVWIQEQDFQLKEVLYLNVR